MLPTPHLTRLLASHAKHALTPTSVCTHRPHTGCTHRPQPGCTYCMCIKCVTAHFFGEMGGSLRSTCSQTGWTSQGSGAHMCSQTGCPAAPTAHCAAHLYASSTTSHSVPVVQSKTRLRKGFKHGDRMTSCTSVVQSKTRLRKGFKPLFPW